MEENEEITSSKHEEDGTIAQNNGQPVNSRKKIGFFLLGIVVACWIAVPILPFFDFPNKIFIISAILIGGEILFVITIALLGKEYWGKMKEQFKRMFVKKREEM